MIKGEVASSQGMAIRHKRLVKSCEWGTCINQHHSSFISIYRTEQHLVISSSTSPQSPEHSTRAAAPYSSSGNDHDRDHGFSSCRSPRSTST